ncbi:MAG: hypothetical protein KGS09_10115 [Nitrospirae bacterium]|nr:hypothetical protein [Nitrospirota bacterium]MDE3049914.1 hypothetical protein [Nitrospirota bacterium]MDE3220686.1 hypothetical protein [Nitrospirota bacterium]
MNMRISRSLIGITAGLIFSNSLAMAQVFPPRQPQPTPAPVPVPTQPAMPSVGGAPGTLTKSTPFAVIIGDPTKAFIQIGNMRSPLDTNFALGRGLAGRIALDKYTHELGSGQKAYIHLTGVSNPPIVTTEGAELRYQFVIPTLQFKTYYKDYSGEGDSALGDLVAEKVLVDLFVLPTLDQRRFPTFHSIRIAVTGSVKEAEKCTYFFDIIFPVNICKAASNYFNQIQPALENGIREVLLQPQTRAQFEQQIYQFVRADLLSKAGINPMSPAQVEILQAEFRGTDYVVNYVPR